MCSCPQLSWPTSGRLSWKPVIAFGEVGAGALDTPVSLLALGDAKGLEFDSVVVVEPALIVAQPPEGLRALYVAVTRCTRRLAIVHREPLPGYWRDERCPAC